jgi:hypothetical protein
MLCKAQKMPGLKGRVAQRITSSLFFLSPLVTSAIPRLTWFFLPLIGITLILSALRNGMGLRELLTPSASWTPFVLLALYLFFNATWAADQPAALGAASLFLGASLIVCASIRAVPSLPQALLHRAALAFTIGALFGALFLLFELLTHALIMRTALNSIDWLQRNAKHMVISHGEVTKIKPSVLDQNIAIAMFNLWPGLLVLKGIEGGARRWILIGTFFTCIAVTVLISVHHSSKVALISSLLIFLCAWIWPRVTVSSLAALWCLAFILVLPAAFAAYKAELHMALWLPMSARHRVIIWEYTAERVPRHLWSGIGAASTPALKPRPDAGERPEGFIVQPSTGEHAHDLYLQTWYELGLLGVILVAWAGAATALGIYLLPSVAQAFAATTFFVCLAIETFAWSMWQPWLMCALSLLAIYVRVASDTCEDDRAAPIQPETWKPTGGWKRYLKPVSPA